MILHNKFVNKTRSTKNQENSGQCFVDNYLTNHLPKFSKLTEAETFQITDKKP